MGISFCPQTSVSGVKQTNDDQSYLNTLSAMRFVIIYAVISIISVFWLPVKSGELQWSLAKLLLMN
jgi:hypothetical protein